MIFFDNIYVYILYYIVSLKRIADNTRTDKRTVHSHLPRYEQLLKSKKETAKNIRSGILDGGSVKLLSVYFTHANVCVEGWVGDRWAYYLLPFIYSPCKNIYIENVWRKENLQDCFSVLLCLRSTKNTLWYSLLTTPLRHSHHHRLRDSESIHWRDPRW
jgi:hypothetical protein